MLIPKDIAQELAYQEESEGFKVVSRTLVDHSRWSLHYTIVVEKDGHFYRSTYSEGATESQDEGPYEYADDEIEFKEVFPKTVTVTIYE